jgi:hypothetical protein
MKQLIILFLVGFTFQLQSQKYNDYIKSGDSLYEAKNYELSAETYSKAFKIKEGSITHYYNTACSWALSGSSEKAFEYLKLSIKKGQRNKEWMKDDKDLISLRELPEWKNILDLVQLNVDEYKKDFDKPLQKKLEKIRVRDQVLRQLYKQAEEKFGRGSEYMNAFWEMMGEQDSINERTVLKIIDENGWVGKSLVGAKANSTLWLVIQHAPIDTQEKYLPLLKESVKKGESSGQNLALLEDRILMRNDKPQVYGSQVKRDEDGKGYFHEIKDPEYVNQRRKEIGLGPIEAYAKRMGVNWTVEQKIK